MPHIDYFSFSIQRPDLVTQFDIAKNMDIPFEPEPREERIYDYLCSFDDTIEYGKRGRYGRMFRSEKGGWSYFDGNNMPSSLVQFSGVGCDVLRQHSCLQEVLMDWQTETTRLDIAHDYECDIEPEDVARSFSNARYKISGHRDSKSGITFYIGSKSSDLHTRVYRYRSPHPRSKFLRVESELHDGYAVKAVQSCLEHGVMETYFNIQEKYKWKHPLLAENPVSGERFSVPRVKTEGSTVNWLLDTVLSAIEKAAKRGDKETLMLFKKRFDDIMFHNDVFSEEEIYEYTLQRPAWVQDDTSPAS